MIVFVGSQLMWLVLMMVLMELLLEKMILDHCRLRAYFPVVYLVVSIFQVDAVEQYYFL